MGEGRALRARNLGLTAFPLLPFHSERLSLCLTGQPFKNAKPFNSNSLKEVLGMEVRLSMGTRTDSAPFPPSSSGSFLVSPRYHLLYSSQRLWEGQGVNPILHMGKLRLNNWHRVTQQEKGKPQLQPSFPIPL